ncbi:hypothetical protein [Bdellovibrio sp. HCB337]|uniref:hypothetical protein n=1 Tax=Bdellovibrio sp. HCB337 TaxID=3394358 RepID=UPI0039A60A57
MNEILDNLYWIEELLPPGVTAVPKHGGMAYYLDDKLVLILVEQRDSTYEHKEVTYPFQIWNGVILPIEYKKQSAFFLKFLFLENHPANKDWLYIPADSESFEEDVKPVLREIMKRNPLLGLPVKIKVPSKEKAPAPKKKKAEPKTVKADKKRENAFIMGMVKKKIK